MVSDPAYSQIVETSLQFADLRSRCRKISSRHVRLRKGELKTRTRTATKRMLVWKTMMPASNRTLSNSNFIPCCGIQSTPLASQRHSGTQVLQPVYQGEYRCRKRQYMLIFVEYCNRSLLSEQITWANERAVRQCVLENCEPY